MRYLSKLFLTAAVLVAFQAQPTAAHTVTDAGVSGKGETPAAPALVTVEEVAAELNLSAAVRDAIAPHVKAVNFGMETMVMLVNRYSENLSEGERGVLHAALKATHGELAEHRNAIEEQLTTQQTEALVDLLHRKARQAGLDKAMGHMKGNKGEGHGHSGTGAG